MKNWMIRLTALLLTVLLASCQTTDYTQEAMVRAREFALEQTKMLPETARNYIRYTTPEVQYIPIFAHQPMKLTEYAHIDRNVDYNAESKGNLSVIIAQFVWNPPELGYSVIAIGRSRHNLEYWKPRKVLLKNTAPYQKFYELARSGAVWYVTNSMLYLSALERLRVSSTEAEVRETSFDIEYLFEEKLQSSDDEWKAFLDTLNDRKKRRQFSLIWRADDKNRRIVITGIGSVADLERWAPACGMVIPVSQLDKHTIAIRRKGPDEPGSEEKAKAVKKAGSAPAQNQKSRESAKPAEKLKP